MKRAKLEISLELLADFCEGLKWGSRAMYFQVEQNGLPFDAKVVDVEVSEAGNVYAVLESASFEHDGEIVSPPLISAYSPFQVHVIKPEPGDMFALVMRNDFIDEETIVTLQRQWRDAWAASNQTSPPVMVLAGCDVKALKAEHANAV